MTEKEKRTEEAVDRFHEDRREYGFGATPRGRDQRRRSEKRLVEAIEEIYPYDDWLKRHD